MDEKKATGYTFSRDKDGTSDTLDIRDPEGKAIATLYFWDEPDTDEAERAEQSARIIVEHLNHWQYGEMVLERDRRGDEGYKILDQRGDYALVVCKNEDSQLVFGLVENGTVIATEDEGDEFRNRVGIVSSSWELWLATQGADDAERDDDKPTSCADCGQACRSDELIDNAPEGMCTERWLCRACYAKTAHDEEDEIPF